MNTKNHKSSDKILNVAPKVDFTKVKETLQRLKTHRHLPIRSLEGNIKDDYRFIGDNLSLLYETKLYKKLHDEISNCFKDIHDYTPGTIGAYLNGCNAETNLDMRIGCTPICAGSVPPVQSQYSHFNSFSSTKSDSDNICNHMVMQAEWNGKRFVFTDMNDVTPRDSVLMYTTFPKISEFPGFSPNEKAQLKNYGIRNVNLIYYSREGTQYTELLNGGVRIDDLPSREASASSLTDTSGCSSNSSSSNSSSSSTSSGGSPHPPIPPEPPVDNGDSGSWWVWILLALIIIIIFIFLYRRRYCC